MFAKSPNINRRNLLIYICMYRLFYMITIYNYGSNIYMVGTYKINGKYMLNNWVNICIYGKSKITVEDHSQHPPQVECWIRTDVKLGSKKLKQRLGHIFGKVVGNL